MRKEITVESKEKDSLLEELEKRTDFEAARLKRYLSMPDLSRKEGSPIQEIVKRILAIPDFDNFDVINCPEIVPYDISFDLFNFPKDHPARSRSDTYFLNDNFILRPHTTVMWYYYLKRDEIKERYRKGEPLGVLSYGKVYRKDEIDRNHMNVFHQIDGLYICKKKKKNIGVEDLKNVLVKIAQAIFGKNIKYRFNQDTFPYTDPSLEMEIEIRGRWVEVLGSGIAHGNVLKTLGIDPDIYGGWAFGFGLERLAIISMNLPDIRLLWSTDERVTRQLHLGNEYKEVSKFPPVIRDISFIVDKSFIPNNYFDLIREIGGDLVEEVSLLDKYEDEKKFGKGKVSYTYRVIYRSNERTLKAEEIEPLHGKLEQETKKLFGADIR